jgi:hypothetical protein
VLHADWRCWRPWHVAKLDRDAVHSSASASVLEAPIYPYARTRRCVLCTYLSFASAILTTNIPQASLPARCPTLVFGAHHCFINEAEQCHGGVCVLHMDVPEVSVVLQVHARFELL